MTVEQEVYEMLDEVDAVVKAEFNEEEQEKMRKENADSRIKGFHISTPHFEIAPPTIYLILGLYRRIKALEKELDETYVIK